MPPTLSQIFSKSRIFELLPRLVPANICSMFYYHPNLTTGISQRNHCPARGLSGLFRTFGGALNVMNPFSPKIGLRFRLTYQTSSLCYLSSCWMRGTMTIWLLKLRWGRRQCSYSSFRHWWHCVLISYTNHAPRSDPLSLFLVSRYPKCVIVDLS